MPGFKCQSKVLVCTLRVVCALSVFAILSLSRTNAGAPTHVIPLRGRHGWGPGTFIQNARRRIPTRSCIKTGYLRPPETFVIVCS
jgi:hypothetical protein